jgi:TP901 family phage tail tape measure protein
VAFRSPARIKAILEAEDRASAVVRGLSGALRGLGGIAAAVGATALARTLVAGLRSAVDAAKEFEGQLARVQAVSGANADEFKLLGNQAKELGATTVFTAKQAAEAQTEFAKAGFTVKEIYDALPGTLDLAAAGELSMADAASITANALRAFGLETSKATDVADLFAKTANTSNQTVADLRESFKFVAPAAKVMGAEITEVSAALALLADRGLKQSIAGSALRTTFATMLGEINQNRKGLGALAKDMFDAEGNFKGLANAIDLMTKAGFDAKDMYEVFGKRGGAAMAVLVPLVDELRDKTADLGDRTGFAAIVAKAKLDSLEGSMVLLKSAVDGLRISVGEKLTPVFKAFVRSGVAPMVGNLRDVISEATVLDTVTKDLALSSLDYMIAMTAIRDRLTPSAFKILDAEGAAFKSTLLDVIQATIPLATMLEQMGMISRKWSKDVRDAGEETSETMKILLGLRRDLEASFARTDFDFFKALGVDPQEVSDLFEIAPSLTQFRQGLIDLVGVSEDVADRIAARFVSRFRQSAEDIGDDFDNELDDVEVDVFAKVSLKSPEELLAEAHAIRVAFDAVFSDPLALPQFREDAVNKLTEQMKAITDALDIPLETLAPDLAATLASAEDFPEILELAIDPLEGIFAGMDKVGGATVTTKESAQEFVDLMDEYYLSDSGQHPPPGIIAMRDAIRIMNREGLPELNERLRESNLRVATVGETLGRSFGQIGQRMALDLGDTLVEAAFGAEVSFAEFFKSFMKQIAAAIAQALILKAIMSLFGGGGGGGGARSGGLVSTRGGAGITPGGTTFGVGGRVPGVDLGRDTVPAVLQPGELVVPTRVVPRLLSDVALGTITPDTARAIGALPGVSMPVGSRLNPEGFAEGGAVFDTRGRRSGLSQEYGSVVTDMRSQHRAAFIADTVRGHRPKEVLAHRFTRRGFRRPPRELMTPDNVELFEELFSQQPSMFGGELLARVPAGGLYVSESELERLFQPIYGLIFGSGGIVPGKTLGFSYRLARIDKGDVVLDTGTTERLRELLSLTQRYGQWPIPELAARRELAYFDETAPRTPPMPGVDVDEPKFFAQYGGMIRGADRGRDTVPAMLQPGELVVPKPLVPTLLADVAHGVITEKTAHALGALPGVPSFAAPSVPRGVSGFQVGGIVGPSPAIQRQVEQAVESTIAANIVIEQTINVDVGGDLATFFQKVNAGVDNGSLDVKATRLRAAGNRR